MTDIVLGKRKALYNAVIKGILTLEGEGKYVSLFMETMNHLNRMFAKEENKRCRLRIKQIDCRRKIKCRFYQISGFHS